MRNVLVAALLIACSAAAQTKTETREPRKGYFSGEIPQYVIEREDGSLYMAFPDEINRVAGKN